MLWVAGHMRKNCRRNQYHDCTASYAGQHPPGEKPARGNRERTGQKRQGDQHFHRAQRRDVADARGERATQQCTDEITHQIRHTEVHDIRRGKPMGLSEDWE